MQITFSAIGLIFEADVDYEDFVPAKTSGPPEDCYPEEGGYIEFESLTVDGCDAMFLLDSKLRITIEEAAAQAAQEWIENAHEQSNHFEWTNGR